MRAFLVCLLIVLSSAVTMKTPSEFRPIPVQNQHHNIQFTNETGSKATQAQISSFINFINSGSIYYRDDTAARLKYISDKMNSQYGDDSFKFTVIQMDNETNYDWSIWTYGHVWATVAPGVDRNFPQNSYMFSSEKIYSNQRVYFSQVGQKGSTIDLNLEKVIRNTILSVQTTPTCQCYLNSIEIKSKLNEFDDTFWNTFCSASYSFYAAVYPKDGKYIFIRPKNCYYILYAS